MFCLAALIPSPPILVPELCGGAAPAASGPRADGPEPAAGNSPNDVRSAVLGVGAALAEVAAHWTVLGVAATGRVHGPGTAGTFRGFGVDVPVCLDGTSAPGVPDPDLPLSVLVAGWLRGAVAPHASVRARTLAVDDSVRRCAEFGARLRAELDAAAEPQGVLVVADGAATLSTAAPGYFDERAETVQARLDRALSTGDRSALLELEPHLCADLMVSGRAAYQALAGLFAGDAEPPEVTERYRGAPFGVGYFAGLWRPRAAVR